MQKRKYILFVIGIVVTVLGLRHIIFLNARHHLLCEVLKPGMSKDEVLSILNQAGEFTMNYGDWPGGLIELGINFTDPKGRVLYGAFDLGFSDYKYERAYISGFERESIDVICDFSQVTRSITATPNP